MHGRFFLSHFLVKKKREKRILETIWRLQNKAVSGTSAGRVFRNQATCLWDDINRRLRKCYGAWSIDQATVLIDPHESHLVYDHIYE